MGQDNGRSGWAPLLNFGDGKSQNGTHMQCKFGEVLRNHGDHARIMRAGRDFAENNLLAFNKEFDSENTAAAEVVGNCFGHVLGCLKGCVTHRLRLPGLLVVAAFLSVADGSAKACSTGVANRQKSDLIIEINEAFDDDVVAATACSVLGVLPCFHDIVLSVEGALALTGGTHYRLNDAGKSNFADGR